MNNRLYESIMKDVTKIISYYLEQPVLEKYGSAIDNPEIFSKEICNSIDEVVDVINDGSYKEWEKLYVPSLSTGDLYAKIISYNDTKWCGGIQFILSEAKPKNSKSKGMCLNSDFQDDGKVGAIIIIYDILNPETNEFLEDILKHEIKHAYFGYYHHDGGKRIKIKGLTD